MSGRQATCRTKSTLTPGWRSTLCVPLFNMYEVQSSSCDRSSGRYHQEDFLCDMLAGRNFLALISDQYPNAALSLPSDTGHVRILNHLVVY